MNLIRRVQFSFDDDIKEWISKVLDTENKMIVELASTQFTVEREAEMYIKGNTIKDITQFFYDLRYALTKIQMKLLIWGFSQNSWTLEDEFCGYGFPKVWRSEFCLSGMAASKQKPPIICKA